MKPKINPKATLIAVPLDVLVTPRNGETMIDRWWTATEDGVLFYRAPQRRGWSPQCNTNRVVVDRGIEKMYPGAEAIFVPVAFVGEWTEEWGYTLRGLPDEARVEIQ